MTLKLKDTFGYCIIPKNTILFRGHDSINFEDCMFFTLKFWVAGAFNNSIQVWRAKKDIEIIFLVESVDSGSRAESSLPRLYKTVFPRARKNYDDLDIKQRNIKRRNEFIRVLREKHEVQGWFTSLEGGTELEVCLFKSDFVELIEIVPESSLKYPQDSLKQIAIFPTLDFFKETYKNLTNGSLDPADKEEARKTYSELFDNSINDDRENGNTEYKRDRYSNLRTKLDI